MDISQYIALFLLKNNHCHITGLGSLLLKKVSAVYDEEQQMLHAPSTQIVFSKTTFNDENSLAQFIAKNENCSIDVAKSNIKGFVDDAKRALKNGKEVSIPTIANLFETNGNTQVKIDPTFDAELPNISINKIVIPTIEDKDPQPETIQDEVQDEEMKVIEELPPIEEENKSNANLNKVLVWGIVGIIIISVGFFVYTFLNNKQEPYQPIYDSGKDTASTMNTQVSPTTVLPSQVVLNQYDDSARAARRVKQLQSYGNNVALKRKDTLYYVVLPIPINVTDTAHLLDSLSNLYNPKDGVHLFIEK